MLSCGVRVQAYAQVATTAVTGTVYTATGEAASGTVLISWPAFSTSAGASVAAGSTSVTLGTGGSLSVSLVANAGSTPMGSYYTAVYHLGDGTVTREYWVVPVSSAAVAVSAIRSTVLPASVAMQTVSKSYVDTAIAVAVGNGGMGNGAGATAAANTVLAGPVSGAAAASAYRALTAADIPALPYAAGALFTATAEADYNYTVSGTSLVDATGANDGTLGTGDNAPQVLAVGMQFGPDEGVSLPAALNGFGTVIFSGYLTALGDQAGNAGLSGVQFLSNTVGFSAFNLYMMASYPGGGIAQGAYGPGVYSNGPVTTNVGAYTGYHVFALTRGTPNGSGGCVTQDHLYVDGVEPVSYAGQGCSAGLQPTGNLVIGAFGADGFPGSLYRTRFYAGVLSAGQVAADSTVIRNEDVARGVATGALVPPQATPSLLLAGDSITFGYPNLTPYGSLLALDNPPTTGVVNDGISGITLFAIAGSEPNRFAPLCRSASGPAVYTVFAGTNDFLNIPGATPASVFGTLAADIAQMKTAGCRVGVVTMLSRFGNAASGATLESQKDGYNALIRQGAKAAGADFLVDAAANAFLGADGANNPAGGTTCVGSTYFQADCTHPTQAGQQLIANAYSNAYNYTFGHNKANPHAVAAETYQMVSGDGALALTGTGAQAVTLPDCTGASGAVYTLNNATGGTKTVSGGTGQPMNGLTSVTVGPNSSLAVVDVPNAAAVGGCHWEF
jgi:lysophospholipase L1-like esterase